MFAQYPQYYSTPAPYANPTYAPVAYRQPGPVPTARYVAAPRPVPVGPAAPLVKSANPEAGASVVQEYRDVSFDGNFNFG